MTTLLAGLGHAHLSALRHWRGPPPTVVSRAPREPYSGLVPSVLRREIAPDAAIVDLARFARGTGASFTTGQVVAVDLARRTLRLADGTILPWRRLSLDLGGIAGAPAGTIPARPIADLLAAVAALDDGDRAVTVAGAGAVGTELALALACRWPGRSITLLAPHVLPEAPDGLRRAAERALAAAGVRHVGGLLRDATGTVFWAGPVAANPLLAEAGLACDPAGFVQVEGLRSVSHPDVFVAGDAASLGRPKAGAYAVAAGPALARGLAGATKTWHPPAHALAIIGTGGGRALAWRGGWWFAGRSAWWLKRRLDAAWMRQVAGTVSSPR